MGNELSRPRMEFSNRSVLSWMKLTTFGVKRVEGGSGSIKVIDFISGSFAGGFNQD